MSAIASPAASEECSARASTAVCTAIRPLRKVQTVLAKSRTRGNVERVLDDHEREPFVARQRREQAQDRFNAGDIEAGERFVREK